MYDISLGVVNILDKFKTHLRFVHVISARNSVYVCKHYSHFN